MSNLWGIRSILVFCVCSLTAGCGGGPKGQMQNLPEVSVVTIQPESLVLTKELPGRTSAFLISEIRPQVNGIIQKRLFTEGSEVKAGQPLYQIDPAPLQAVYDKALANMTSLKLRVQRYKEVLSDKAVSQQEFDDAEAAFKQAQAEFDAARINLGYTSIVSPINGRIGASSVTDGNVVTAYQAAALATVQQLDPIYVDIPQSTTELLRLRRSMEEGWINQDKTDQNKVKLILADGTEYPRQGDLQFQDITVDPTTSSVILRVIFPNPEGILLPNMFVRAVITEGIKNDAVLAPQQGVFYNPKGQPYSLIVDNDGKVQQRILEIDRAIGDKWFVTSGLNAGDRVIIEGVQRVRAGIPVKVVPAEGPNIN